MTHFALIHSPLVGPFSWQATAAALRLLGERVIVPDLRDAPGGGPFWKQHTASAVEALRDLDERVMLVAHSGAGALLPAVEQALGRRVAGYVFVDAVMPDPGRSRLEGFGTPDEIAAFRAYLESGGRFPNWSADDLAEVVPDAAARARLVRELRPRGLDYFTEPIPVRAEWPEAPGAYPRFTETYRADAQRARALGWPVMEMAGGHFDQMVKVEAVAEAIEALSRGRDR
jgi:pimeloyl-ACP methyl ester carboxylesterase